MKNLLSLLAFSLIAIVSTAQTYANDSNKIIDINSVRSSNEQLNILQSGDIFSSKVNVPSFGNSVFIDQVGFGNLGTIEVASNDSRINLLQSGSNNEAQINLRAVTIRENVVQRGNDNFFRDYSINGTQLHTADVFQDGSYNQIISTGKNSISERIKITQKGIGREAYIIHN